MLLLVALVCGWCACGVFAQGDGAKQALAVEAGAGGAAVVAPRLVAGGDPVVDRASSSGHGWAFIPGPGTTDGFLVHFVPRQAVQRASSGSVRLVMALNKAPLALAGWEGEALLLVGPPGDEAVSPMERSISSIRAVGPVSVGNWGYRPSERLELKASLPQGTVPRSMVGSSHGPVVVWERVHEGGGGELEIAVLDSGGGAVWRTLQPPLGFPATAAAGEAHALTTASGVMVATRSLGESDLTLWRAAPDLGAKAGKGSGPVIPHLTRWENAGTARLPAEFRTVQLRTMGASAAAWLWRDGGQTLLAVRGGDGVTLWRLDATEPVKLWHEGGVVAEKATGAMVMGGLGAATVLIYDPVAPGGGASRTSPTGNTTDRTAASLAPEAGRLRVVEVSGSTGAVLHDLAAHTDGFLSRNELQVLWLLFIGVGVVILWVVLRIDGPQELQLPEGTALASPLRRVVAGALDVAIAVGVTSLVVGSGPGHWLAATTSTSSSLVPLLSVLGLGCGLGTLGEATIGCSPGKLLVGARVLGLVAASPVGGKRAGEKGEAAAPPPTIWQVAKPRIAQAFVRNAVRWFMPPMGMMMVVDNNWRHPGDLLARTVVVVRFEAEEEGAGGDEGQDE